MTHIEHHLHARTHDERRRPNKRDFLSFFLFGWGVGISFMVFSSAITRSCAKCSFCRAFSTQHTLCLFSVGASVMPHMLCTKAYTILQWLLKLGPQKKTKVGKKQIVWERKVSNQQVWYWCNQCIPTSQKRKMEKIDQWDVRTSFDFVTLVQSKPSRDRVKYNIQLYTFPPVGSPLKKNPIPSPSHPSTPQTVGQLKRLQIGWWIIVAGWLRFLRFLRFCPPSTL